MKTPRALSAIHLKKNQNINIKSSQRQWDRDNSDLTNFVTETDV